MDEYSEFEQWERTKQWLRENGAWIVAGIALGAFALAGWRLWEQRQERRAVEASTRYERALEALSRNDRTRAFTLLDELRNDYGGSAYSDQGDLLAARVYVEQLEFEKAAERLARVMENSSDRELALVARGRLARVRIQQGRADDALALLTPAQAGAFAERFNEIRGDALLAKGERAQALEAYKAARTGNPNDVADSGLLDLKIAELEPVAAKVN